MEYFEKYMARLGTEGMSQDLLEELRQEATHSLANDPPERALALTGQLVAALRQVVRKQNPPEPNAVYAVNAITEMMIEYLWGMGWHMRAIKTEDGWVYKRPPA